MWSELPDANARGIRVSILDSSPITHRPGSMNARPRLLRLACPDRCGNYPPGGRYASFLPAEAMARIFGTVNPLPNLAPSWSVAPT